MNRLNEDFCTMRILLVALSFLCAGILPAQNISGIINSYAEVTAISGRNFTIGTPGGKTGAALSDYDAGSVVLIYQAKGASGDTTNVSTFGEINSYNSAGRYEMTFVKSRVGSVVKLTNVRNSYDADGKVQLVSVPNYTTATINATLTASDWNDSLGWGGILALKAEVLEIGANIDLAGKGFEGGGVSDDVSDPCNAANNTTYASTNVKFGFKGEGIIDFPSLNRARAEIGNGGGGANPHNGGAGGGSNWASGGTGGIGWPGDGCTPALSAGGFGGNALDTDNGRRLFFGGGGGGGQQNNSEASAGGDGGGIVVILADTIRLNCPGSYDLSVDGEDPDTSGQDGAGGGGAGGSIIINTNAYDAGSCTLSVHANGGNGADVEHPDTHGGGGGGATGPIATNIANTSGVIFSSTPGQNGEDCDTCTAGGSTSEVGTEPANDSIVGVIIPGDANGFSCAPGGLGSGLLLWVRADEGVTTVSGAVSAWADQSGNQHDLSQGTGTNRPLLVNSGDRMINFNPSLDFDGSNDLLEDADGENYINGLTGITISSILQADGIPTDDAWFDTEDSDNADDVLSLRYDVSGANSGCTRCLKTGLSTTAGTMNAEAQSNLQTTAASLITYDWESSTQMRWFVEGASTTNSSNSAVRTGSLTNAVKVIIGDGTKENWNGLIAEMVVFDERLSDADRLQLESYLALKYGINKTGDYILPDSTVIWDDALNNSYNNAVFGLGSYDGACLDMSQSQSEIDQELLAENPSDLSSGEAIMFGHNNLDYLQGDPSDVPVGVEKRLQRIWLTQEGASDVGTVDLLFDTTGFGSLVISDLRLLIDRDGDGFSDGDVAPASGFSFDNGYAKISGINLQDGDLFTLGTVDRTQSPLPLDLLKFTAKKEGSNAVLDWEMAEAGKWSKYEIQRAQVDMRFKKLAEVKADEKAKIFGWVDEAPHEGTNYYRLKAVNKQGVFEYSYINQLHFEGSDDMNQLFVFPNPITPGASMTLTGANQISSLTLIDAVGKRIEMKDWELSNSAIRFQIPSNINSGIYLLKADKSSGPEYIRFVVE